MAYAHSLGGLTGTEGSLMTTGQSILVAIDSEQTADDLAPVFGIANATAFSVNLFHAGVSDELETMRRQIKELGATLSAEGVMVDCEVVVGPTVESIAIAHR